MSDFGVPRVSWSVRYAGGTNSWTPPAVVRSPVSTSCTKLGATIPESAEAAIVHGDYRLDNVLIAEDGSLSAVLDWKWPRWVTRSWTWG